MLVNSKKMLESSLVFQFNINNLEWTKYILEEANVLQMPIILGVSEGAINYMGGYNTVVSIVKALIEDLNINIDVVLHLDHGKSIESCKKAIDAGFTSVMYDGSKLSLEENIKNTKEVVEYAKKHNVTIEAELGVIGDNLLYTDIEEAKIFVKETNIDSFAPSIGNAHGIYKGEPNINFDLVKELKNSLNLPLVLHGGSGLSKEVFDKLIKVGINKININTDLQVNWSSEVKKYLEINPDVYDPRKIISAGEQALKETVKDYLITFSTRK